MALLLLGAGCDIYKGSPVSQEEFGEGWPLTVPRGRLLCVVYTGPRGDPRPVVTFIAPDGKKYGVNGNAKSVGHFLEIDSIQKPDPTNPRAKKNIEVLADKGMKLCP